MLEKLPIPSKNKTGWPWTEETEVTIYARTIKWPKISIVTPSYNQGLFIEETIRSILLQNYPNLEYIIIDGGSTDNTIDIIGKYEKWITCWVSENDKGQTDALIKGIKRSSGEIISWLNSDDLLGKDALANVSLEFTRNDTIQILNGDCILTDEKRNTIQRLTSGNINIEQLFKYWIDYSVPPQPSIFFKRNLYKKCVGLNTNLHYAMDYDLWLQFAAITNFYNIPKILSYYRVHESSKTGMNNASKNFLREMKTVFFFHLSSQKTSFKIKLLIEFAYYHILVQIKSFCKRKHLINTI